MYLSTIGHSRETGKMQEQSNVPKHDMITQLMCNENPDSFLRWDRRAGLEWPVCRYACEKTKIF